MNCYKGKCDRFFFSIKTKREFLLFRYIFLKNVSPVLLLCQTVHLIYHFLVITKNVPLIMLMARQCLKLRHKNLQITETHTILKYDFLDFLKVKLQ